MIHSSCHKPAFSCCGILKFGISQYDWFDVNLELSLFFQLNFSTSKNCEERNKS